MSLIEEALRRVQQPNPPKQGKPAQAAQAPASPPAQPETVESIVHSWPVAPQQQPSQKKSAMQRFQVRSFTPLAVGLVALAIGGWVLGLLWLNAGSFLRTEPAKKSSPTQAASAVDGAAASPAAATTMVLNGVVIGNGEPYAVIDGRILSVGEQINGTAIEEITERTVKLRQTNGNEIILQVPR